MGQIYGDINVKLSDEECEILRCKNSTSSWGGRRYNPYAFTEQGIYMLMTVLKGDLATKQSKEDLLDLRKSLSAVDDKVADIIGALGNVVTKSELANVMLDFGSPSIRRGWLILNGQHVVSDLAYQQIYSSAKNTILVIDNYIGLKTLVLLKNVSTNIKITIVSDNVGNRLHQTEFDDFIREYPLSISFKRAGGIFHDRYIVIDYNTDNEQIYHCGASSKDGGNKVTTITAVADNAIYHPIIDSIANNQEFHLS